MVPPANVQRNGVTTQTAAPSLPLAAGAQVTEQLRLVRELGAGGMGAVWAAEHASLGPVAVKFVHPGESSSQHARLFREGRLTARIDHPHVVRILEQGETDGGAPFLVMELVEGESLSARLAQARALSLEDTRRLVAQVAQVLGAAHAADVLHRDIKPGNIMLLSPKATPPDSGLFVKVIDFGIARAMEGDTSVLTLPGFLIGTPAFMAPGQLIEGRPADIHADLWALSVLAYQALTGQLPFRGGTRAALCAAMVLKRYDAVSKLDPQLPQSLDDWFERAFSTEVDVRFESAADLAESFEAAALNMKERSSRPPSRIELRIPNKLFGRERELSVLRHAFEQAAAGRSRVLLVTGYAGIGKTALVAAVEHTLVNGGATFVSGKFDQFNRATPYDSLIQAFRELIRKKVRDAPTKIEPHQGALAGASGRALIEVIPELEQLIGPQPALDQVSPEEARNRFQVAVERLVSSLASAEHPLVLFFDDLQWADLASIDLITNLATDPESKHVLFVGAYRDNEVDGAHPLTAAIDRLRTAGAPSEQVSLGPLTEDAVLDLISGTFPGSSGRARFATVCHQKTHGNPFFLRRLLESLTKNGPLRFDHSTQLWSWDLPAIEARAITEDVVEFVAAEIRRMPAASGRAIGVASCIGDAFDLETLAAALGTHRGATLESLRLALASELLVPATEQTALASDPLRDAARVTFRFAHDRVRQAARLLVPEDEAAQVHLAVARFMLARLDENERERRLFELVDHLNQGLRGEITPQDEALLRSLNLRAARRATSSAAFAPAHRYMSRALAHLSHDSWTREYVETLAMHVEGARSAYLSGDLDRMQSLVDVAVGQAKSALDRVTAREVELHALVSQQKLVEAVQLSVKLLAELGLELPTSPAPADVEGAVRSTLARLSGVTADDLARIPMALDPTVVAMLRIQNDTMSSAYLAAPNLLPIMGCNIVRMTLDSGICKESPYGFAILGLVLCAANMIDVAYGVGKLALELLGRVDDRSVHPRTLHVVTSFVRPFVEPVQNSIDDARAVFRIGMDTGDFEYAAWGLHTMVRDAMFGGMDLQELESMYDRTLAILEHHRQVPAIAVNAPFGQMVANLRGRAANPTELVGPAYDEREQRKIFLAIKYRGATFVLSVLGGYVRFLFRDLKAARDVLEAGAEYADGAVATYNQVYFHQLRALTLLGLVGKTRAGAAEALEAVAANVAQLRTWQSFSPLNHDHRVALVEAELARVAGNDEAATLYDRAITLSQTNRFLPEAAVANELAYRYHEATANAARADAYLSAAVVAYERWGATAKAAHLRAEHAAATET